MRMSRLGVVLLVCGTLPGMALAESLPSSKATFAYSELIALPSESYTDPANSINEASSDSGWASVLSAQIKTANQKDLFINPSLQCGIVTDTTVKSKNGSRDTSVARGTIRVRVKITAPDGTVSYAEPNNTPADSTGLYGNTDGGLVYCDREQTLSAKFSGLNCVAAPYEFTDENNDGVDDVVDGSVTCASPEELQLILKTLNASSFNFVAADLTSGIHLVDVQAKTSTEVGVDAENGSLAGAEAFIGAGSVTVEEVRMIKGNDGTSLDLR